MQLTQIGMILVVFTSTTTVEGALRAARQSAKTHSSLGLPSNSTSIRKNIRNTFSCDGLSYGYYADVDNDCQIFHICYPYPQSDGSTFMYKWSFICPEKTIFNQETLTCTRPEDAVPCGEVSAYYFVNDSFGNADEPFSKNEIKRR
ncbi:uncharacterized protein [Macrobrachium rosenbergii]|uniref:uncharacterized protein n=1 Tax=Macrobrachium rosenbergii TaxID=79674 RepID=UPI0034D3A666